MSGPTESVLDRRPYYDPRHHYQDRKTYFTKVKSERTAVQQDLNEKKKLR